jgi:hypothetical protein
MVKYLIARAEASKVFLEYEKRHSDCEIGLRLLDFLLSGTSVT